MQFEKVLLLMSLVNVKVLKNAQCLKLIGGQEGANHQIGLINAEKKKVLPMCCLGNNLLNLWAAGVNEGFTLALECIPKETWCLRTGFVF